MTDSPTQSPSDAAPDTSIRSLARPIIATTAAWSLGYSSMFGQPQFLGPIMAELEIGEAAVGRLFSYENASFFITMLLVAGPLARWSRPRAALIGGLIGVVASLASGFATSFEWLVATRVLAGIALGLTAGAGTASAASSASPGRIFTIASFTWGATTALQQWLIPYVLSPYGFAGGYFLFAAIYLPLIAAFIWLISSSQPSSEKRISLRNAPNRALALYAMAALLIYEIGQSGVFTFVGQIGENSGLNEIAVGEILGWTRFVGLLGGALAIWVGTIGWRKWPVLVGLSINAAAVTALAVCSEETLFAILNAVWNIGYYFVTPLVMATLARLDRLGRWAVTIEASWNGGTFLGPAAAGWLIENGGYGPLSWMAVTAGVISLVIMIFVLRRTASIQD